MPKQKSKTYLRSGGVGRVVYLSESDNQLFKQMLLDLYDRSVFRSPDELADELFSLGLHTKAKDLRSGYLKYEQ